MHTPQMSFAGQDEHDCGDAADHAAVAVGGLHALRPLQGEARGRSQQLRHQHHGKQVSEVFKMQWWSYMYFYSF